MGQKWWSHPRQIPDGLGLLLHKSHVLASPHGPVPPLHACRRAPQLPLTLGKEICKNPWLGLTAREAFALDAGQRAPRAKFFSSPMYQGNSPWAPPSFLAQLSAKSKNRRNLGKCKQSQLAEKPPWGPVPNRRKPVRWTLILPATCPPDVAWHFDELPHLKRKLQRVFAPFYPSRRNSPRTAGPHECKASKL